MSGPNRRLSSDDQVAVIGAGTMGAGIALVAARAGHQVGLHDASDVALERAVAEIELRLGRDIEKGRLTGPEAEAIEGRIHPVGSVRDLTTAAVAIEAVVEDLTVKQDLFRELERVMATDAILATNTSSFSVTAIAGVLERPDRVVGMHFFNPPALMPLVEVVRGTATASGVVDEVVSLAAAWDKTPVVCTSTPGFIVNRVARPFYGEALRLLGEEAASLESLDALVRGAGGFRMGPFELMDLIGIDINLAVSKSVYEQTFHDPRFTPSVIQQSMVDAGRLGRKAERGFYDPAALTDPAVALVVAPAERAAEVVAIGHLGHAKGLADRLQEAGISLERVPGAAPGHLVVGETIVVPTDGRTGTALVAGGEFDRQHLVILDLARDWATATMVAAATPYRAGPQAEAPSPLQDVAAVLAVGGISLVCVDDTPGLVLMRVMAQLASVACDAAAIGVATPADIDTAMRLGTNYPEGPLEWADRTGLTTIVEVLDHMREHYREERYRAAASLRRAALAGTQLREDADG